MARLLRGGEGTNWPARLWDWAFLHELSGKTQLSRSHRTGWRDGRTILICANPLFVSTPSPQPGHVMGSGWGWTPPTSHRSLYFPRTPPPRTVGAVQALAKPGSPEASLHPCSSPVRYAALLRHPLLLKRKQAGWLACGRTHTL